MSRRALLRLAVVAAVPAGILAMLSLFSRRPDNLGVSAGRLADCPPTPNCVSTQASDPSHRIDPIPFSTSAAQAMARLEEIVEAMPRTRIVTAEENYLHAEFRTAVFRFVDDVEFLVDPDERVIHFRSASRVGYSDFGVNRRRMERIRSAFLSG